MGQALLPSCSDAGIWFCEPELVCQREETDSFESVKTAVEVTIITGHKATVVHVSQ